MRRPRSAARAAADPEALEHGLDDGVQLEARLDVQLGGESHLRVHDAVGGEVLRALGRHADQRVLGLHHADRVPERLQVAHERPGVRRAEEPPAQLAGVRGRQVVVADRVGELDDGGGPQPAVEVVVQQHLRRVADGVDGERHRHPATLEHAAAAGPSGRHTLLRSGCSSHPNGEPRTGDRAWSLPSSRTTRCPAQRKLPRRHEQ